MKRIWLRNQRGVTLIEMMIVLAVMGFVMAAVYSFYISQTRASVAQEDIVEVQQNLRAAMDMITHDIQKAGFLVPTGTTPLTSATATGLTINTLSATGIIARLESVSSTNFTIESPDAVDRYDNGDIVKVIRPVSKTDPEATAFTVAGKSRSGSATSPSLDLTRNDGGTITPSDFMKGDVIARASAAVGSPDTIAYSLLDGNASSTDSCPAAMYCVQRVTTGGSAQMVATSIAAGGLQFSYILDDSSETAAPGDLTQIRAVRVTLTGVTTKGVLVRDFGGAKTRVMTSIVSIRNR